MRFCRSLSVLALLLCCVLTFASPKARNWDKVLDRYENLCDKCLELKQQADSGQNISKSKFSKLIKDLNSLKSELKEASGQMSPEQAERFAQIRDRFLEAQGLKPKVRNEQPVPQAPKIQASALAPTQIIVLQRTIQQTLPSSGIKPEDYIVELPEKQPNCPSLLEWESHDSLRLPKLERIAASKSSLLGRKFFFSGIVCVSVLPKASYGLLIALDPVESRLGGYIRMSSNFAARKHDYDCLSDGSTSYGCIWTSGKTIYSTAQIGLGPCLRVNDWLRLYSGLGYGSIVTLWEDSSGQWARVLDYSPRGLLAEVGAIVNFGKLDLSLGISCTALKVSELQLGLGYNF